MRQAERPRLCKIVLANLVIAPPCGGTTSGAQHTEVGANTLQLQRRGLLGNGSAQLLRNADRLQSFPCGPQLLPKFFQPCGVFCPKPLRIVLKRHPRPHDFAALLRCVVVPDENSVREAIQKLWAQVSSADFLSDAEKRAMLGLSPMEMSA